MNWISVLICCVVNIVILSIARILKMNETKGQFAFWIVLLLVIDTFIGCAFEIKAHEYDPADIVLIGKVVQHEAGNQSDLGKRLVCDTILNRVESENFPNTVYEVINQPGQYCNPKKFPPDDMYKLVAEEIYTRTNHEVLWYRTKRYHKYGTPLVVEGNHYFSGGK